VQGTRRPRRATTTIVVLAMAYAAAIAAQRRDAFVLSRDHPAIAYSNGPVNDRIDDLNRRVREHELELTFEPQGGYLRSALTALDIPVESQVAVFGQNSFQAELINLNNPRTLYFNDEAAVGYVRGGELLEIAMHDPRQGVIFYTLDQKAADVPQFRRNDQCLACHLSWTTLGVPGLFVFSMQTVPADKNAYASGFATDHRTTFGDRWGGWYVTGSLGSLGHIGNRPISTASTVDDVKPEARELTSLADRFEATGYPSPLSDVAALMVLEHQTHMVNLITRVGWEARVSAFEKGDDSRVKDAAADLVDYLLFVHEPPLPAKVRGSSGFADAFATRGPFDGRKRTLRQLDLDRRLLRYPCSYMIYSRAFEALPDGAKQHIYTRLWQVLSGQDRTEKYTVLSTADRQAIIEILRETKDDLPEVFRAAAR
jgi:hypothetical protein